MRRSFIVAAGLSLAGAHGLALAEQATAFTAVQVTATRKPEPIADIPASMTIVSGAELRARGANDLRTALSLAAGVEGTPGGDGGPAGTVPSIWGLREADAYLLVVDGVPWGGAFNPATPSITIVGRRTHRDPARRRTGDVRRDLFCRRHPCHPPRRR